MPIRHCTPLLRLESTAKASQSRHCGSSYLVYILCFAVGSSVSVPVSNLALATLGTLLVGVLVKGDEEEQVASEEAASEGGGTLAARAAALVGEHGHVGSGKVGVTC